MSTTIQGGCHCGALRYQCSAEPLAVFYCHCKDCQKMTGAPFAVEVVVPAKAVSISGEIKSYLTQTNGETGVWRKQCAHCGSPVLSQPQSYPDIVSLRSSSLDDASWLQPTAHVWTSSKQPWLQIGDNLPQFERDM